MPVPKAVERDTGLTSTLLKDSKRNVTTAEYFSTAKAVGAHRLLFTYDYVNPVLFESLRSEWKAPEVIAKSLPARGQGYELEEQFSIAEGMAQHYIHHHREAWLGERNKVPIRMLQRYLQLTVVCSYYTAWS
jgi:hypothetical protein